MQTLRKMEGTAERLQFDLLAKEGRWPDTFDQLPGIKNEMFACVITELDLLYPQQGLEYLFSVFDLLTFRTADKDEQKQKLSALCERFGKPHVKFSKLLQKTVRTEAIFDQDNAASFFMNGFMSIRFLFQYQSALGTRNKLTFTLSSSSPMAQCTNVSPSSFVSC